MKSLFAKPGPSPKLTKKQKDWAYDRWCEGYTMYDIAAALDVCYKTVQRAINGRPRIRPILIYQEEARG